MMFNSQKINNDPKPWTCSQDPNLRSPIKVMRGDCECDPRPEFDNSPNPILVKFREDAERGGDLLESVKMQISILDYVTGFLMGAEQRWEPIHSEEHMKHARKVLERIVNVYS